MRHIGNSKRGQVMASIMMLFLIAAVAIKAILPAGFMPVIGKDGFTQIVICSGAGEKLITVPSDDAPEDGHQGTASGDLCAFQVVTSSTPLPSASPALPSAPVFLKSGFVHVYEQTPRSNVHLSFDARGPPLA